MSDEPKIPDQVEYMTWELRQPNIGGFWKLLKWLSVVILKLSLVIIYTFLIFFAGQQYQSFEKNTVDVAKVCNYCVGELWPRSLEIGRSELRLTCGKDDIERINLIKRGE